MRLAFDMSSVIWTCLSVGVDREGQKIDFEGKRYQVNTSAYGYENAVNHMLANLKLAGCMPKDMIMVFEGLFSKAYRVNIDAGYKAQRGKRPPECYAAFQELAERLRRTFGMLGALALSQDYAEGDDTLGYLAENSEEDLRICTNDNDLAAVVGVNAYGATIEVMVNGVLDPNKYGNWPHKYITVYKSLVGDTSDGIKGIKGFGDAAFTKLYQEFGEQGLADLLRLGREGSIEELVPKMDNPILGQIVKGGDEFLRCYQLARLHTEWVSTMQHPLQFSPGLIKGATSDERLAEYAGGQYLVTAPKFEEFVAWARPLILAGEYTALDIETSTSDESDEWLIAQGSEDGVDVIGSELTGMSLTFGRNLEHTVYIPVDHAETSNVDKKVLRDFIRSLCDAGVQFIIHNYSFEGTVLYNEWGLDWKDNGSEGYLPNCLDTKLEASYVDENNSLGLKKLAQRWFNYAQVEYNTVTTIDGVKHKMRELRGRHVKDYGCDDTIVTASFHNFAKLFMQLEHTWQVYLAVEIDAMYLHTQSFVHGTTCDVGKSKELEAIDDATYDEAWTALQTYLIEQGWEGTIRPVYTPEITPAQVKEAFLICTGTELKTAVRKLDKLIDAAELQGAKLFAECLHYLASAGTAESFNALVAQLFRAEPVFNPGSTVQMQKLLYETMALPMRVFNKPTAIMKKQGIRQGSPKSDELAIAYAKMMDATPEQKSVLEALRLMKMVQTRRGLYYKTYPYFVHWKTGRIHSSHNQSSTNTRRASASKPNIQQMPKHPKIEGQAARFREVFVPHKRDAVVVSMDFMAQELRVIAEYSQDPNMLACYVGDNLIDMHALTGLGIAKRKEPVIVWHYELFADFLDDKESHMHKFVKECRALGKKVNFTTEYGAMAPKLALTLLVPEDEAQEYIDAKEDAFPVVREWKDSVIAEARDRGFVMTMLGARRHLAPAFTSGDRWEESKAERQAVNFKVQSSSGEMTKLAEGRMWSQRLEQRFDCEIIGPVHDEVIASCAIKDLPVFVEAMHWCMVQQYADMKVPVKSSISFGPSFGVQFEIGELPTAEAVALGLVELDKWNTKQIEEVA